MLIKQGKTNIKYLLIVVVLAVIVGGGFIWWQLSILENVKEGEIPKKATPQEVAKTWFESIIEGNWEEVFLNMVDMDGKAYSEECEEGFKKAFGNRVGAEYTFETEEQTINCEDSDYFKSLLAPFGLEMPKEECVGMLYSYSVKFNGNKIGQTDNIFLLRVNRDLKVNEQWKVLMYCAPLLSYPIPPTIEEPEDQTTNWKTYQNKEYGFEIKYPLGFDFSSEGPNLVQQALDKGEQISGTVSPSYDTVIFSDNYNELIRIDIFHKYEEDIRETNYIDGYLYLYGPCDTRWGFEPEVFSLSSINDVLVLNVIGETMVKEENGFYTGCYYLKNLKTNLIVFSSTGYKQDFFSQILSTFRFIEDETADWKTYRNEAYGYETSCPSDWEIVEAKPRIGYEIEWAGDILISDEVQKVTFLEKNYSLWPGSFEISVLSNPEKLSIKDWWKKELEESDRKAEECLKENPDSPCLSYIDLLRDEEEILFKNQVAIKTSEFAFDSSHKCIRTEKNYHIYTLCYYYAEGNDPDYIEHSEIYNQIISTFRFLD